MPFRIIHLNKRTKATNIGRLVKISNVCAIEHFMAISSLQFYHSRIEEVSPFQCNGSVDMLSKRVRHFS